MWGNATFAPDDIPNSTHTHGALIAFRQSSAALQGEGANDLYNMTSSSAGTWILERTPETFQVRLDTEQAGADLQSADITENDSEQLFVRDRARRGEAQGEQPRLQEVEQPARDTVRLPVCPSLHLLIVWAAGCHTHRP